MSQSFSLEHKNVFAVDQKNLEQNWNKRFHWFFNTPTIFIPGSEKKRERTEDFNRVLHMFHLPLDTINFANLLNPPQVILLCPNAKERWHILTPEFYSRAAKGHNSQDWMNNYLWCPPHLKDQTMVADDLTPGNKTLRSQ